MMQLIRLFDSIWRAEGLDLCLQPYNILCTGLEHGLMQFVPSASLASILTERAGGSAMIAHFKGGSNPEAMRRFVASCAGYCVITYVLGIGDRHLDNLLLTTDGTQGASLYLLVHAKGNLFHVDFSYLFGADPKPFPPPMKLCREMVEAMGGLAGPSFASFKSLCFTAYAIARKQASRIIAAVGLSAHAITHVDDALSYVYLLSVCG